MRLALTVPAGAHISPVLKDHNLQNLAKSLPGLTCMQVFPSPKGTPFCHTARHHLSEARPQAGDGL